VCQIEKEEASNSVPTGIPPRPYGSLFISHPQLAQIVGIPVPKARKIVKALIDNGHMHRISGMGGLFNYFQFNPFWRWPAKAADFCQRPYPTQQGN
jgi:hypothetical protein